jgi:hypothetical protein
VDPGKPYITRTCTYRQIGDYTDGDDDVFPAWGARAFEVAACGPTNYEVCDDTGRCAEFDGAVARGGRTVLRECKFWPGYPWPGQPKKFDDVTGRSAAQINRQQAIADRCQALYELHVFPQAAADYAAGVYSVEVKAHNGFPGRAAVFGD